MLTDYRAVTADTVRSETDAALERAEALIASVVGSADNPGFEASLRPIEVAEAEIGRAYGRTAFLGHVHPDAAVRDAGQEAEERLNKWRVGLASRRDLFRVVAAFAATEEAGGLEGERRRLLEHWMRDFRRAGQELDEERRAELERLQQRMVELETAFQRNVNEHRDAIEVTREALAGLPDDYVARLSPGSQDGTYRVSLDYPELEPFMEQAHDRSLREALFDKHWNRAVEANRPLLAEALRLRQRIAEILGQPTWAHHALEVRMAREPAKVAEFYERLLPPLTSVTEHELEAMAKLLTADVGAPTAVTAWDWRYYDERLRRDRFGVDQNLVSQYLPLQSMLDGLFELTADVFGLTYRHVDDARAWHGSVELFEVRDRDSDELLAWFYTDLFPREGKYTHAAAFPLVIGHRRADGSYERPISALVANFAPPTADRPSLLRHSELRTLFHEFGHILHMSLTRAEFARFSAGETELDFVEAPSQIMEHWIWDADVLARFARHHQTGKPIPRPLVEQLVAARNLNVGLRTAIQAFYGTMDLGLHDGDPEPDLDAAIRTAYGVTGMPYPERTFMLAGFAHVMGGYDAGYYGYLWSEVIGDDMFGRFQAEGVTSPAVGQAYRRTVLEPNGTRPAEEMVHEFLGRDPTPEAFLRLRGLLP